MKSVWNNSFVAFYQATEVLELKTLDLLRYGNVLKLPKKYLLETV